MAEKSLVSWVQELEATIDQLINVDAARLFAIDPPKTLSPFVDRAHAISALLLGGGLAELLKQLMMAKMVPLSGNFSAKIFDGYGPLSSFRARIDLAFAFGLIDHEIYDDLRIIKDVRNEIAHPPVGEDLPHFKSEAILKHCKRFKQWADGCDAGELFIQRAMFCAERMKSERERLQAARAADGVTSLPQSA
jgi:DNA-binding MltR family transcriptional regulator